MKLWIRGLFRSMCTKSDTYTHRGMAQNAKIHRRPGKKESSRTCTARGGRVLLQILELLLNPLWCHLPLPVPSYFQKGKKKIQKTSNQVLPWKAKLPRFLWGKKRRETNLPSWRTDVPPLLPPLVFLSLSLRSLLSRIKQIIMELGLGKGTGTKGIYVNGLPLNAAGLRAGFI